MYLCCAGSKPTGDASKKYRLLKKKSMVPASVCTNGLTLTFRTRCFHRVFLDRTPRTAWLSPTTRQSASKKQNCLAKLERKKVRLLCFQTALYFKSMLEFSPCLRSKRAALYSWIGKVSVAALKSLPVNHP